MWCCSCCWSPAGSVPLPDTRSLKVPHWGFFEIQPRWWVILDQALSRGEGGLRRWKWSCSQNRGGEERERHLFDGSSGRGAQNLPNLMGGSHPANESSLLNLKAIMFPEWGREGKGPVSLYDRSVTELYTNFRIAQCHHHHHHFNLSPLSSVHNKKILFRNICQVCSIFSSHICEAIWLMG